MLDNMELYTGISRPEIETLERMELFTGFGILEKLELYTKLGIPG